jgi:hypothetical protein
VDLPARNDRRRSVLRWDIAVSAWVIACLGLAIWTAVSVHRLDPVGQTLIVSSDALDEVSSALDKLTNIPFVGDDIARVTQRISDTAKSARASGVEARSSIDSMAITLSIALFAIAVIPPVVAYLAVRSRWVRSPLPRSTPGPMP